MILEKDKVYKVYHNPMGFGKPYPRDFLLICPIKDIVFDDGFLKGDEFNSWHSPKYKEFECLFIVCFDGSYVFNHATCVTEDCHIEPLNEDDLKDIRKVLNDMSGEYKFNRKLNKVVRVWF